MKNKVYVIYEERTLSFKVENDLKENFDCVKVFSDKDKAEQYFINELEFQCAKIRYKGKVVYDNGYIDKDYDDFWFADVQERNDITIARVYYWGTWQYDMYLKEMEVE